MQLQWQSTDVASEYVYLLDIVPKHSSDQVNSSHREITLQDLTPGTLYNITIIPEVNNIKGDSSTTAQYTRKCLRMPSEGSILHDSCMEDEMYALAKEQLFLGSRLNVKLLKLKTSASAEVLLFSWGIGVEPCELGLGFRSRK